MGNPHKEMQIHPLEITKVSMSGERGAEVVMGRLRQKALLPSVLYKRWFPKGVYQQTKGQPSFYTVRCGISDISMRAGTPQP